MYVTPGTTQTEIKKEIKRIEEELNSDKYLFTEDRIALHEELDYLYSFITEEKF